MFENDKNNNNENDNRKQYTQNLLNNYPTNYVIYVFN